MIVESTDSLVPLILYCLCTYLKIVVYNFYFSNDGGDFTPINYVEVCFSFGNTSKTYFNDIIKFIDVCVDENNFLGGKKRSKGVKGTC